MTQRRRWLMPAVTTLDAHEARAGIILLRRAGLRLSGHGRTGDGGHPAEMAGGFQAVSTDAAAQWLHREAAGGPVDEFVPFLYLSPPTACWASGSGLCPPKL